MKKTLLAMCMALSSFLAHAQHFEVLVEDACTGLPLPNYPITLIDGNMGGVTATQTLASGRAFAGISVNSLIIQAAGGATFASATSNGATVSAPAFQPTQIKIPSKVSLCPSCSPAIWNHVITVQVNNPDYTDFGIAARLIQKAPPGAPPPTPDVITWCDNDQLMWRDLSFPRQNVQNYTLEILQPNGNPIPHFTTSGSGPAPQNIDLKDPFYFGNNTPFGQPIGIRLTNDFGSACGGTVSKTRWILLEQPSPVTFNSMTLNGDPERTTLCDGDDLMLLQTSISGVYTDYKVEFQRGHWSGGVWIVDATAKHEASGSSVPNIDLYNYFSNMIDAITGEEIRVVVTVKDICGDEHSFPQNFYVYKSESVTNLTFSINGQSTNGSTLWYCPNQPKELNLVPSWNGEIFNYIYTIEKGYMSGSTFIKTSEINFFPGGNTPQNLDILDPNSDIYTSNKVAWFLGIGGTPYNGPVKITLLVDGPCTPNASVSKIFNIQNTEAIIDFDLSNFYCTSTGGRSERQTDLNFVSFTQPTHPTSAMGVCYKGWLGAQSGGIYSITANISGVTLPDVTIAVDEVDGTTGAFITSLGDYTTSNALQWQIAFDHFELANGYFTSNYNTIKNNKTFKVTVSANTLGCGPISNYSYFKIYDGGPLGANLKMAPDDDGTLSVVTNMKNELVVYPNPTNDKFNLEWTNEGEENASASFMLMDITGRTVSVQNVTEVKGNNKLTVDVSALPTGVYQYKLNSSHGLKNGKITKQ